jgi:hypothetical protein
VSGWVKGKPWAYELTATKAERWAEQGGFRFEYDGPQEHNGGLDVLVDAIERGWGPDEAPRIPEMEYEWGPGARFLRLTWLPAPALTERVAWETLTRRTAERSWFRPPASWKLPERV